MKDFPVPTPDQLLSRTSYAEAVCNFLVRYHGLEKLRYRPTKKQEDSIPEFETESSHDYWGDLVFEWRERKRRQFENPVWTEIPRNKIVKVAPGVYRVEPKGQFIGRIQIQATEDIEEGQMVSVDLRTGTAGARGCSDD